MPAINIIASNGYKYILTIMKRSNHPFLHSYPMTYFFLSISAKLSLVRYTMGWKLLVLQSTTSIMCKRNLDRIICISIYRDFFDNWWMDSDQPWLRPRPIGLITKMGFNTTTTAPKFSKGFRLRRRLRLDMHASLRLTNWPPLLSLTTKLNIIPQGGGG